jgi:uncharacterized protein (TIGR04255 family)
MNMKIPKKITPDFLKDTIIQLVFNPGVPPELVLGEFKTQMSDVFTFVTSKRIPVQIPGVSVTGLPSLIQNNYYFTDKANEVKVEVSENALIFNSLQKYIGWERYLPLIDTTISTLLKTGTIHSINRIGLRYISEYPEIKIFDNLDIGLKIDFPNKSFESTQIRSEYKDEQFKVILNIANDITRPIKEMGKPDKFSIIDIDVLSFFDTPVNDREILLNIIDKSHFKQKTIFFSLLTEGFLNSLNPEY